MKVSVAGFVGGRVGFGTGLFLVVVFGLLGVWFVATDSIGPGLAFGAIGVCWLVAAVMGRSTSVRDTPK